MIQDSQPYHLIHILGGGEHKTPLVASQVFDRAQVQATMTGAGKPLSVSVWIIAPMRVAFEKQSNQIVKMLKKRCPDVKIKLITGINRLGNWPGGLTVKRLRRRLNGPAVFHVRGEMFINWALIAKSKHPQDAIILDVRGFYPLERFINDHSIADVGDMTEVQKQYYYHDLQRLQYAVDRANEVLTVSEPLKEYLKQTLKTDAEVTVIPCCVKDIVADDHRKQIRDRLGITDKVAVLYLGGIHKNQYIEELAIPFIRSALSLSDKYVGIFITQNEKKLTELVEKFGLDTKRIRVISVPQNEVATYLTGMDIGLLLRAPSRQNNFSQPVKFGEYLSAGIPVILEEGTGNMSTLIAKYGIGCVIQLTGKDFGNGFDDEVKKALDWYNEHQYKARTNAREFVRSHYTWASQVPTERTVYARALQKAARQLNRDKQ